MESVSNYEILAILNVLIVRKFNWFGLKYQLLCKLVEGQDVPEVLKSDLSGFFFLDSSKQEFKKRKNKDKVEVTFSQEAFQSFNLASLTDRYLDPKVSFYIN
ncbi:MAG: hypothetical protein U0469_01335 [Candidatus Paceibacterota bacterium]|jgi:hypothetical protein